MRSTQSSLMTAPLSAAQRPSRSCTYESRRGPGLTTGPDVIRWVSSSGGPAEGGDQVFPRLVLGQDKDVVTGLQRALPVHGHQTVVADQEADPRRLRKQLEVVDAGPVCRCSFFDGE